MNMRLKRYQCIFQLMELFKTFKWNTCNNGLIPVSPVSCISLEKQYTVTEY